MFTNAVKSMIKNTPIHKWEYIDQKIELRRKGKRIQFIEEFLPKNGIGAELGVFKGHLSPILLEHTDAKKLHLIDPWYFLAATWPWANGNQSTVDALRKILQTFKQEIEDGRILIHVGDDVQVLTTFCDQYFDWVYIDTSHEYEHTKRELQILANKVKENGVIAGDDWQPDPSRRHHGVYQAVNEFVGSQEYSLVYSDPDTKQWAIKKR
ncbi:class I SAM-dependent methyltransferase [Nostoc sp. PA-18-2419]|uniref:class I SAM-dependent methyltransferase n=1 Tax=Nostoc sp. PA-18-2419 TaxID=2575443 RepID=UPI001109FB50|nr:class I SAM-dependent methyltransferase [Nostoc sp. PA-18-2419]